MPTVQFQDLGRISYQQAWDYQQALLTAMVARKRRNRDLAPDSSPEPQTHHLLFCEHPHVYTLGKSGKIDHLLLNEDGLRERGIEFFKINRGGDITYHGPGQITGYPIFDLDEFFTDVKKYVRYLEEVIIRVLAQYDLTGDRSEGESGVWLEVGTPRARKICAVGVHLSRWVTMHGFAFNVNTDLNYFHNIVPCGITDKGVTSLQAELGRPLDMATVKAQVKAAYREVFGFEYTAVTAR